MMILIITLTSKQLKKSKSVSIRTEATLRKSQKAARGAKAAGKAKKIRKISNLVSIKERIVWSSSSS